MAKYRKFNHGGLLIWAYLALENLDEIEADFQRYYRIDIREIYDDERPLTMRRLAVLTKGLPPESLFRAKLAGTYPISGEMVALFDIYNALTGERHWYPELKEREAAKARQAKQLAEFERVAAEHYAKHKKT